MSSFPPAINALEGERLTEVIKDWASVNGLVVRPPPAVVAAEADPQGILSTPVPVTLFPSPFPKVCFDQGVSVQQAYNELYAAISQDEEFLAQTVKEYVQYSSHLHDFKIDRLIHRLRIGLVIATTS